MDWLQSLLWDPSSVAHIVLLYAFVVAAGVYLGKIKIFGVSLGVTFVLFAGILMGHFGFTADTHILHRSEKRNFRFPPRLVCCWKLQETAQRGRRHGHNCAGECRC